MLRRASLRDGFPGNSYCCLGVLCDLAIKSGEIAGARWEGFNFVDAEGGVEGGILPGVVREWAGLDSSNPAHGDPDYALTELNDNVRKSFTQIADLIEQHF